jgi:alkylated DNA repair dioxygenase AlkB
MNVLLDAVNEFLGTKYNSMLVNRYRSRDVFLGVHKDDEECLVKEASISTLSFGCIRRMKIAPDGDKYKPVCELVLKPGSLLT